MSAVWTRPAVRWLLPALLSIAAGASSAAAAHAATVPAFSPIPPAPAKIMLRPFASSAPSCASARACFVIGRRGPRGSAAALGRYDSTRMRVLGSAPRGAAVLSCPSTRFCMAVGYGPKLAPTSWTWSRGRWHRRTIGQLPTRRRQIHIQGGYQQKYVRQSWQVYSVSCGSPRSCVAVGGSSSQGPEDQHPPLPLIERFNGRRWHRDRAGARYGTLTSVSCPSAKVCMAVGETDSNENRYIARPELLRHGRWRAGTLPAIDDGYAEELGSVSCSSTTRCVGVGFGKFHTTRGLAYEGVVARWDGTAWTTELLALRSSDDGETLNDVSCPPGAQTACVATGTGGNQYAEPGAGMVTVIPAQGSPVSAAQTLPYRGEASLDCPSQRLCVANGQRYSYRTR